MVWSNVWDKLKSSIPFYNDGTSQQVSISSLAQKTSIKAVKASETAKTGLLSLGSSVTGAVDNIGSGLKWGLIIAGALLAIFIIREIKRGI